MKVYEISMLGRLWRDSYGNTYHTARIMVNGAYVGITPITYGYGWHFEHTAKKWLAKNSYIKETDLSHLSLKLQTYHNRYGTKYHSLRRYCEDKGIKFDSVSVDVKRKKELK